MTLRLGVAIEEMPPRFRLVTLIRFAEVILFQQRLEKRLGLTCVCTVRIATEKLFDCFSPVFGRAFECRSFVALLLGEEAPSTVGMARDELLPAGCASR
jgi:hypothetical protein